MSLSAAFAQLRLMKHYLIACTIVFLVGIYLGATNSGQFQVFIDAQLEALKQITRTVEGTEKPQWTLFWVIFWNNASKSLLVIALGVFVGVIPLIFLVANGLILGYVMAVTAEKGSMWLLFKGLAPHGILELPAIVIACALGLRLGVLLLKALFSMISPSRSLKGREQLVAFLRALVPLSIMLVITLLLAAIIESTITLWLVKG